MEEIFNNPAYWLSMHQIFLNLNFEDLVACAQINKNSNEILKSPNFWIKKWIGLTSADKTEWISILDVAKTTNQEQDVLKYIKRVIQRGHCVSVPCFINENDLARLAYLPETQILNDLETFSDLPEGQILVDLVNSALDEEEYGILQLLAPLIKNLDALEKEFGEETRTPIIWASEVGDKNIVQILAPLMKKPNAPVEVIWTPISIAAFYGHLGIVQFLAPLTKNSNSQDNDGHTPIHVAAQESSPIHMAAYEGHLEIVRFLASVVSDPNLPANDGCTPIHVAAEEGHVEIVRFLASVVSDSNIPNNDGETPIDLAIEMGHQDIVDILTQ